MNSTQIAAFESFRNSLSGVQILTFDELYQGVSTTGGIGTIGGVLVGVLVFEFLKIVLQFLGVNPYYNYMVQGIVIVTAVALDIRKYIAKK